MESVLTAGSIVWAKLKGHPWWPAMIQSEDTIPESVKSRKTKTGKFVVFYFGSHDYGWHQDDSIKPFEPFKGEYEKNKKSRTLFEVGLKEAQSPELAEKALQLALKAAAEAATENGSDDASQDKESSVEITPRRGKPGRRRKSMEYKKSSWENVDGQSDGALSDSALTKLEPATKKRRGRKKKESISTPITPIETSQETPVEGPSGVKKRKLSLTSPAKSKSRKISQVFDEKKSIDEDQEKSEDSNSSKDKVQSAKKPKSPFDQMMTYRYKVQRFLKCPEMINMESEREKIAHILESLENYSMEFELLKTTKIGKVLNMLTRTTIPEDSHNMSKRSGELCDKWRVLLPASDKGKEKDSG